MSAEINNSVHRQELLKQLIKRLHAGEDFDAVQADFAREFKGVGADEIAAVETELVKQGAVKVEEIQKLCDVHASLFEESIADIHSDKKYDKDHGHPTWILKEENRAIERLFSERIDKHVTELQQGKPSALGALAADLEDLWQIDIHYSKKENLWFPIMERYGITAPPQVMWGVDDEIREKVKSIRGQLDEMLVAGRPPAEKIQNFLQDLKEAKNQIVEMISKEENILIPMVSETFFLTDWRQISEGSAEIGYCLLDDHPTWTPPVEAKAKTVATLTSQGIVQLPTGSFTLETLTRVLNTLPIDITFVDANDEVGYFSQSSERIFPRTEAIIGRKVVNCHPPASMHVVEKILADFKSGARDLAEFYIHLKGMYVYIRYFPIRDDEGTYLGTLEVTQNIAPIQEISGDKRLLDEDSANQTK
ncbi:MAG: DUF438 domain-containing protein [Sphaerochaetaceae bacterium]|jgi:DUF438 domain-containing protein|nr:DUF438 domain-containing protein [Sphaerochaetaceae bacterium]MDD4219006.1 DUF438 domain-containing protein [Sphaerochaetaceae bacterium]MDY0371893.1 DUF438 domain-containing protein [Sphaerochaetaceae bacterium]